MAVPIRASTTTTHSTMQRYTVPSYIHMTTTYPIRVFFLLSAFDVYYVIPLTRPSSSAPFLVTITNAFPFVGSRYFDITSHLFRPRNDGLSMELGIYSTSAGGGG